MGVDVVGANHVAVARGISARLRLSKASVVVLGDLDPESFQRRAILDPWNGTHEIFDASYSRLYRCVSELSRLISDGFTLADAHPEAPMQEPAGVDRENATEREA